MYLLRFGLLAALAATACHESAGGDDDATPLECPAETATTGALALDGVDDYARTPKVVPALGLSTFTIETWVRRDGEGVTYTTGAGGLRLVPIAGKGLGEGDKSNVDCNYSVGFWGDVLGADFEDMATGANHPVMGKTAVPRGEWHHIAATYDGAAWRLYLDGKLDAEAVANATPRADSIHPFGIGTAIDSAGAPHGFLAGALDELRVWDRARTPEEIADGMYRSIAMADGLVARWAFDAGGVDPAVADDSVHTAPVALTGGAEVSVADVAALDHGSAPVVAAVSPADGAASAPGVVLDVSLEMESRAPVDVTYHVRELTDADDFTIVVLPDTQIYTLEGRNLEKYFHDQTQWVRDNRERYNIVGVIHNGDVINNEPQIYQWEVASAALARLEKPEPALPDGMPWGVSVGNHDNKLIGANTVLNTDKFNQYFGVNRFAGRAYYGGHYGTKNDHSWVTFSAGGLDFVVVSLMYELDPDPAAIAWARSIFQMHPNAFGILNTHYLLTASGRFSPQSQQIYAALKDLPNVQLMTGGHVAAESRRVDAFEGHTISSMLADFQGRDLGGGGFMRIWEFSPASQRLSVRTYSPTMDKFETDADSEFTLDVDLRGAGGPFRTLQVKAADPAHVALPVDGLEVGKSYEWYAEVASCGHRMATPLYRFTTMASARAAQQFNDTLYQPSGRDRTKRVTSGVVNAQPDDPSLVD
ncbi:MAG TPA: LamG-like jellyroll fold domain-containing protein [Kofleriaceae bacterium]|nr:LamG-like jellyroll fold domain-containing protein [Kofleriaceae bacterium]